MPTAAGASPTFTSVMPSTSPPSPVGSQYLLHLSRDSPYLVRDISTEFEPAPLGMPGQEVSMRDEVVAVVSSSDEVVEMGVVSLNSEALFARELCDLLVALEAACPGYGKEIACALTGEASPGVIMKVEKSLRRIRKKRGVARKASAAA